MALLGNRVFVEIIKLRISSIRADPKSNDKSLEEKREKQTQRKRPCEYGGRDWSYEAPSQETSKGCQQGPVADSPSEP